MTEREIRQLLSRLIDDIDSGRRQVARRPRRALPSKSTLGGTLLVAAVGLSAGLTAGGCSSGKPVTTTPQPTATTTNPVPPPQPPYAAPGPGPTTQPIEPIDPGPVAEYMAPEPEPIDQPAQPLYGVEAPD